MVTTTEHTDPSTEPVSPAAPAAEPTEPDHAGSEDDREPCPDCRGTGRKLRVADWLAESVALLPTGDGAAMDGFTAEFYRRLIAGDTRRELGDQLGPLFPKDLITGDALNSRGNRQRDVLLTMLVELVSYYDPDHPESTDMQHLVKQLQKEGRNHASFRRPDGTERGATAKEYAIVRAILLGGEDPERPAGPAIFGLLPDVLGRAWLPQYSAAWDEAIDFATDEMLHAAKWWRLLNRGAMVGRMPR